MTPVSDETIRTAISIIGADDTDDEKIERDVRAIVVDDMTARRLIDWIPEAFGIVVVSHISSKIIFPTTFSAKFAASDWVELPLRKEPIFAATLQIAQAMFHSGPRELFQKVSFRSSTLDTVNNTLNAGATLESLDGARLSGPALIGIPAEVYIGLPKSLLRRLLRRLEG
jgi:hypothetical protein